MGSVICISEVTDISPSNLDSSLCFKLVDLVEARSDDVKSNIALEPGILGHESRQIGSGQTGDGKSERQHFRSHQTKMDRNG